MKLHRWDDNPYINVDSVRCVNCNILRSHYTDVNCEPAPTKPENLAETSLIGQAEASTMPSSKRYGLGVSKPVREGKNQEICICYCHQSYNFKRWLKTQNNPLFECEHCSQPQIRPCEKTVSGEHSWVNSNSRRYWIKNRYICGLLTTERRRVKPAGTTINVKWRVKIWKWEFWIVSFS